MIIYKEKDFISKKYYEKNLVIEASAGTGKTYSIQNIVKMLVENKIVDIDKILIVTYTEKATGELKDRIRGILTGIVDDDKLNNLNIFTIHSFCQNAIKEFGLEANKSLALDVIDEPSKLGDFFDRFVRTNDKIKDDIAKIISLGLDIDSKDATKKKFYVVTTKDNTKDLKKTFVDTTLKYYLDSNYVEDNTIISLKNCKLDLFEILLSDKPYDELYAKNADFKKHYDNAYKKGDFIVKYFLNLFKANLNDHKQIIKKIDFEKYEIFDISPKEKEAFKYFLNLKIEAKKIKNHNSIRFDFETVDLFFDDNKEFKEYYEVLKNGSNISKIFFNTIKIENKKRLKQIEISFNNSLAFNSKLSTDNDVVNAINYLLELIEFFNGFNLYELLFNKYKEGFYKQWQEEKESNKWQTFNDMLRIIRETLNTEPNPYPLKTALQKKYTYAIVDEFQDTNQLQFDTFKKIFMEDDKHHMFVVGDPKQSIYSFQGADLEVYNIAKKEIESKRGLVLRLDTNYRSTDLIVKSCNNLFSNEFFTLKEKENIIDESIKFEDSKPKPYNDKKSPCDKVIWIGCKKLKEEKQDNEDNNDSSKSSSIFKVDSDDYAKIVVNTIVDCFKKGIALEDKDGKRPLKFSDFAILARTRSEMDSITRELKKCGIPYIKYKDNGLFNSNECKHFVALLEAINTVDFTGYNRKKYYKALFTDFFGYDLKNINSEYFNHDDDSSFVCFEKWKKYTSESKWEDLIDDILFNSNLLDNLKSLDKLQSLTIYKQLGDYSISYLYNNHNLNDLINKLNNVSGESDDDEADSGLVEIGTDLDCVQLMTIHASKGLQFPIVISAAGYKAPITNITSCIYHDKSDGNKRKISFKSDDSKNDNIAEWLRLLYVCFTRSEYILMLPYASVNQNNYYNSNYISRLETYMKNYVDDYNLIYLESCNNKNIIDDVKKVLSKSSNTSSTTPKETITPKELIEKLWDKRIFKHSYSSLSHPKDDKKEEVFELDPDKYGDNEDNDKVSLKEYDLNSKQIETETKVIDHIPYDDFPRGSSIGSAMHEVFERIDYRVDYEKTVTNIESIISQRLKANRIKETPELIKYIKDIVINTLNAKLPIINGSELKGTFSLNELKDDDKKPEIEFNFKFIHPTLKHYLNGFIDLLFKRGNYYSILDWKSDTLNEDDLISYNNPESLKEHTDNHYSIQRVLYSYCLIKWLKNFYPKLNENQIFDEYFGGIYYVYIRGTNKNCGNGIYSQTWKSYKDLEDAFNLINNLAKKKK